LISSLSAERQAHEEEELCMKAFAGISLKVDGVAGPRTSAAYKTVTGKYLTGDPLSK